MKRRVLVLFTGALLSCAPPPATHPVDPALPAQAAVHGALQQSPAGRAAIAWLEAYNQGGQDLDSAIAGLYSTAALERRSVADRARGFEIWRRDYGSFRIERIDTLRSTSAVVTVRESLTNGWGMLFVDVDAAPPHHIVGLGLVPFVEPPDWRLVRGAESDVALADSIGGLAERLNAADAFAGVVLIARGGVPILRRAYGLADRTAGIAHTPTTAFELASASKMFTAVAVARLVDDGRLSFSDAIASVLPDFPAHAAAGQITIHHLITMSSGLPDVFRSPRYWRQRREIRTLSDYWVFFATDSLQFSPGTAWDYSNSNFLLLGSIVERVAGVPFSAYVNEHIFAAAGMRRTSYRGSTIGNRARGYTRTPPGSPPGAAQDPERWFPAGDETDADTSSGSPAGGGVSTADDLLAFSRSLVEHRLLSAPMTARVLEGYVKTEYGGSDGYGFETRTWNGVRIVGHGGAFPGVSTQVDIYPDLGYTAIVLSNLDASGAQAIANRIRVLLAARRTAGHEP